MPKTEAGIEKIVDKLNYILILLRTMTGREASVRAVRFQRTGLPLPDSQWQYSGSKLKPRTVSVHYQYWRRHKS